MKHLVALFLFFLSLPSFSQSYDVVSCGACKGSGKTACYGCMGQGETTTYVMDYNCYFWPTQVQCSYCGGNGQITCVACKGAGEIKVPKNVGGGYGGSLNGFYNGGNIGSSSSSRYNCSGCGGTGRCTACGGVGKQKSSSYYTDGHTIVSNCPTCRGTGKCGVCHGRGSI